jgi:hypothetical protein
MLDTNDYWLLSRFPGGELGVQLDCLEDSNTYIRRAERTAHYNKGGESLLSIQ